MLTWFYFFSFLASIVMLGSFLYRNKRIDTMYVLLCIMVSFNSLGRWLVSLSSTTELAVWASKIVYAGGIYLPFLLIVILARLCEIRIPKWITILFVAYDTLVLGLVMTIGHSEIYYKSLRIAKGNGYYYLVKEYGPAHVLYPVMMILSALLLLFLLIQAFRKRNAVSFKTVASCGGLGIAQIVTYLLTRLLHSPVEWVGIGYLFAVLMVTWLFDHVNMFDMTTNVANAIDHMGEYGYIVFDLKMRFINANTLARSCFPEIATLRLEEKVPASETFFYREVMEWFYAWCDGNEESKTISLNNTFMELSVRDVVYGRKDKKVGYLIEMVDRTAEHQRIITIEHYNTELAADVKAKTEHINYIKDMMVLGMASMVESRDNSTGGHIRRTSDVVRIFAEVLQHHASELNITADFLDMVIKAAPMHDLGKIAVNDVVLRKNGKFTEEEYAEMKRHSEEGVKIVRSILEGVEDDEFVTIAENVAHYHHEKWNGQGYPCGLTGTEIPIEARIMALADVFDALVSERCYKEAFGYEKAFAIIEDSLGSHFDPLIGKMFMECRPALEELYDGLKNEKIKANAFSY